VTTVDAYILTRIRDGHLRLVSDDYDYNIHVEYWHRKRRRWYRKKPDAHPLSGRLRFRFGPKRLTVYRNRLVWMIVHKREIPKHFVIDHLNGDRADDRPDNLVLMTREESHKQGHHKQQDSVLEYLCRWFEFMGKYGREPETVEEVSYVEVGF